VGDVGDGRDLVADADEWEPEAEDDQSRKQVGGVPGVRAGLAEQDQPGDPDR
jgi:hypothetical protein